MMYPFVKQSDIKDCGVCCLLMLVRYYGGGVSKEYLRNITNTTRNGVSAYDLIEGSKMIGFDSYGVSGELKDLKEEYLPCIAHVTLKNSYQHFIVIYKIDKKKKRLLIADPNNNHTQYISFDDFSNISNNNYIILCPNKKIMFVQHNKSLFNLIYKIFSQFLPQIIKVLLLSFFIMIINILISFQLKIYLDKVINYNSTYNIFLISILFFLIIFIRNLFQYRRNQLINKFNHILDKTLFKNVYNHLLSLPYLYYKNRTTGEIVYRVNDLICIRDAISKFIITAIVDLFMLFGSIISLFILNSSLAFIILFALFILILLIYLFSIKLNNNIYKSKVYSSNVNSYLVESIGGIETIKSNNIVSYVKDKFLFKYSLFNKSSLKYNSTYIKLDLIKTLIIDISNLILIALGSYYVVTNKLSLAILLTFISLSNYVFSPIDGIVNLLISFNDAKVSYDRIRELYEIEEEVNDNSNNLLNNISGDIKTDNLSFSYNNRDLFLKNINLTIKNKSKILIYGKSGSGKSTIAKLLAGILKVNNNSIFINNYSIEKYSSNALNSDICYVTNQETLFTDTVYNNIVLDKDIDPNKFYENNKLCMVNEFIDNKTLAYNTLIEENGFNFSGGEKQRIILARALLKDSNIYILDEALNQVDVDRERTILTNIFNKYPDKTFIYISHRFHNKDLFDKKYKIEDGISYEEAI